MSGYRIIFIRIILLYVLFGLINYSLSDENCSGSDNTTFKDKPYYHKILDSDGKNYTIDILIHPNKNILNNIFTINIVVKGGLNKKINFPLNLRFDAGMQEHNHGMVIKPRVIAFGKGRYNVEGV
jgi:hypothetical protein